jgi:hypothetical protein
MKRKNESNLIVNWISVNERIPMSQALFLVTNIDDKWVCCGELNDDGEWCNQFSEDTIRITHWALLPEPPKV